MNEFSYRPTPKRRSMLPLVAVGAATFFIGSAGAFSLASWQASQKATIAALEMRVEMMQDMITNPDASVTRNATPDLIDVAAIASEAAPQAELTPVDPSAANREGLEDRIAAARALAPGGVALAVLDRDRGAKRYARDAGRWFGTVERLAKRGRADVVRLADPRPAASDAASDAGPWAPVEGAGEAVALPGTYAASKLDPGTAHLLAVLDAEGPTWRGLRVLDLGCGWGPLARFAASEGGEVARAGQGS